MKPVRIGMDFLTPQGVYQVKETTPDIWLVHEKSQHPHDGKVVWFVYSGALVCEEHGKEECLHVQLVKLANPELGGE